MPHQAAPAPSGGQDVSYNSLDEEAAIGIVKAARQADRLVR